MRAAPALDATLDNARPERLLVVMLHLLAGLVWQAWGALHALGNTQWWGDWPAQAVVGLCCAALGWMLARRALPMPPGSLCWTGQRWQLRLQGDQALQRVQVTIDLGNWLLLRLQPADGRGTLWRIARARSAGPAWHALRVALHAHDGVAQARGGANTGPMP